MAHNNTYIHTADSGIYSPTFMPPSILCTNTLNLWTKERTECEFQTHADEFARRRAYKIRFGIFVSTVSSDETRKFIYI